MSQYARGRRPLDTNQAEAQADAQRRAHYLKIAASVSSQQQLPSNRQPASAALPPSGQELAAQRKEAFLQGGAAAVAAPSGRVGDGAFSIVRVVDGQPKMAIKTYEPRGDAIALQHLNNELALAGRMRHPNIIGPGAVRRRAGDSVEIQMEYAADGSLADYVKKAKYASRDGSPLAESEACALFAGLVDGVAYLHGNGITHGDLKLSNAMLDGAVVRLIDFGTARAATATAPPPLPGTLPYMAPETLDDASRPQDGRAADVWALGVVLCNLLDRGGFPFTGRDEAAMHAAIQSALPQLPARLSASARELIEQCLAKDARARPTISEVRAHPWFAAGGGRGGGGHPSNAAALR